MASYTCQYTVSGMEIQSIGGAALRDPSSGRRYVDLNPKGSGVGTIASRNYHVNITDMTLHFQSALFNIGGSVPGDSNVSIDSFTFHAFCNGGRIVYESGGATTSTNGRGTFCWFSYPGYLDFPITIYPVNSNNINFIQGLMNFETLSIELADIGQWALADNAAITIDWHAYYNLYFNDTPIDTIYYNNNVVNELYYNDHFIVGPRD